MDKREIRISAPRDLLGHNVDIPEIGQSNDASPENVERDIETTGREIPSDHRKDFLTRYEDAPKIGYPDNPDPEIIARTDRDIETARIRIEVAKRK